MVSNASHLHLFRFQPKCMFLDKVLPTASNYFEQVYAIVVSCLEQAFAVNTRSHMSIEGDFWFLRHACTAGRWQQHLFLMQLYSLNLLFDALTSWRQATTGTAWLFFQPALAYWKNHVSTTNRVRCKLWRFAACSQPWGYPGCNSKRVGRKFDWEESSTETFAHQFSSAIPRRFKSGRRKLGGQCIDCAR